MKKVRNEVKDMPGISEMLLKKLNGFSKNLFCLTIFNKICFPIFSLRKLVDIGHFFRIYYFIFKVSPFSSSFFQCAIEI